VAGPLPRKKMYKKLIEELVEEGFFDRWRATNEVCDAINRDMPLRWTPMNHSSVYRYMRKYAMEERYYWNNSVKSMMREWKKV